jgi:hypothetical protein
VKPSITVDERGVLLHITTAEGNGVAIPLDPATALEMWGKLSLALKSPDGRSTLLRGLGRLLAELAQGKGKSDGA